MRLLMRAAALLLIAAHAQAQKRDTIRVKVGDSVLVLFSVSDTSHVSLYKNGFKFTSCGSVTRYARDYPSASLKGPRRGDTVVYVAPCPAPVDTTRPPVVTLPPITSDSGVQLPRVFLNTARGTPTRTVTLGATSDLQAAIDSARAGDRLLLPCKATYTGNYVLRGTAKNRELATACVIPPEGTRVSPRDTLTKIVSPSVNAAISVAPGASGWRLVGLDVSTTAGVTASINSLLELGDGQATSSAQIPRNIVVDRVYAHGLPTQDIHRCIVANADSSAIVDSYISECHGSTFSDVQAVTGYNFTGPFKIANSHLEGATEVIAIGGADPKIANLVPADIEIRGNHITRPMSWQAHSEWVEKDLVELKIGRRVLIDGNVLENAWVAAQQGIAFVVWSVNQNGGCLWCVTEHVTISNNLIRNVAAGVQLSEKYSTPSGSTNHIALTNNWFQNVANPSVGDGGYGFLFQGSIANLSVQRNTLINPSSPSWTWGAGSGPFLNHVVSGNLTGGCTPGQYIVSMQVGFSALVSGTSAFSNNAVACYDDYLHRFPAGNVYPSSLAAIPAGYGADTVAVLKATAGVVKP